MKYPVILTGLGLVILSGLFLLLLNHGKPPGDEKAELRVFCAAGFQKPMSELAKRYEAETGVRLNLQFGGSGALGSQLRIAGGDLFFPADEGYLESLEDDGLLESSSAVTTLTAGLVVPKGNPKRVSGLNDLWKKGVTVSVAEKSASIGKFTAEVLADEGVLERIRANIVVTKPTVTGVVSDVAIGAVDVGIAWDVVARNFSGVAWMSVPEFEKRKKRASIGILKKGRVVEAKKFVAFLMSDAGRIVFEKMGYRVEGGN